MKLIPYVSCTAWRWLPLLLCGILPSASSAAPVAWPASSEAFSLEFDGGRTIKASELHWTADAVSGRRSYAWANPAVQVVLWHRDVAFYHRTMVEVTNTGTTDLALKRIVLLDAEAPVDAAVLGAYAGSPVVVGGTVFAGVEHPYAENTVAGGRIRCALPLMAPLAPKQTVKVSLVIGQAAARDQLRRTFAAYLNRERPRACAPFLLHNTWYNIGYSNPFSEADELAVIDQCGRELVEKRGVKLDAFVLDDGWDDTRTLWRFNHGWPDGLRNMRRAAAEWGARPGIWISPWGGYNEPKKQRLAAAAGEGFEMRDGGFSLAGPKYYARFRDLCVRAMDEGDVSFFKFDGIGANGTVKLDPATARDFDAMLRLIDELRARKHDLYISQTVGTWPSPWWLLHVDNVWRGGEDHDFAGVGSARQQWITYRDAQVFANVVKKAPLFPLNSLMLHGIILAKHAEKLATAGGGDFASDVRSYFGSGAQLEELYLSPELLTQENWDELAEWANWARERAAVLQDSHWLGGDPAKLEPYGWAAWSPQLGILTVRNPSDHVARLKLEAGAAFELPESAPRHYRLAPALNPSAATVDFAAGVPVTLTLQPFEVRVLEARPVVR